MPETAAPQAPSRRRLALPLTAGLALHGWGHYVLLLPGSYDGDGAFRTWALAAEWVTTVAGLAVALVCGTALARRLGAHLALGGRAPRTEPPVDPGRRRRSPAVALLAGGAALVALAELPWVLAGPGTAVSAWVLGAGSVLGGALGPAAMTAGAYLALRRLEDHLDGRHRDGAPTARGAGGRPHASGLTTPRAVSRVVGRP